MIKYFSTSVVSRHAFLFLFIIFCWLTSLHNPVVNIYYGGSLFPKLTERLSVLPYLSFFISLVVYITSFFFLNYIAVKQRLSGLISLLTILFYVLITASFTSYFSFNLLVWVALLLIIVLHYTMTLHDREYSIKNAFNAGFFLGASSLLYPPLIFLVFVIWTSIFLHRENNWRSFVSSLLGVLAPFMFLFTWFFLNDDLEGVILQLKLDLIPQFSFPDWSIIETLQFTVLLILGSILSMKILGSLSEKSINLRRNLLMLAIFFAFIILITLLFIKSFLALTLAAIPLALMASNIADKSQKNKWVNWGLISATLIILVAHLVIFLNVT